MNIYFERLNFHRPVFLHHDFEAALAELYQGEAEQHDPGFLCSVYLVLTLGTLLELNHRVCGPDRESRSKSGAGSPSLSNVNVKALSHINVSPITSVGSILRGGSSTTLIPTFKSRISYNKTRKKVSLYPPLSSHTCLGVVPHSFARSVLLHARDLALCSTWQRALCCTPSPTHNTFNNLNTYYIH